MTWIAKNKRALVAATAMVACLSGVVIGDPVAYAEGWDKYHKQGLEKMAQKNYDRAQSYFFRAYSWAKRKRGSKANPKYAVDYCHALLMAKKSEASWLCPEALTAAGNGPLASRVRGYVNRIKNGALMPDETKLGDSELEKVVALPGRAVVGPLKPTWCDIADPKYRSQQKVHRVIGRQMRTLKGSLYESHISEIASRLCKYPNAADWNKQTGYFVQRYINMTGASKKDAMANIRARVHVKKWQRQAKATCSNIVVSDEASPAEKRAHLAMWRMFGCGNSTMAWRKPVRSLGTKLEWDLDKRAEISSELMRTYYALTCMKESYATGEKRLLASYALCSIDSRSLSRSKLDKELSAGKYNAYAKTLARESFAKAKATEASFRRHIDKLIKRDKTYKKIFIDAPAKAWATWKAQYAANKAVYEAAYKTEKAVFGPSKSAMRGCLKPLRALFQDRVRKAKPRNPKQARVAATDEVGGILLNALAVCAAFEGEVFYEGDMYHAMYKKTRNVRGPRAAVYFAVLDAVQQIVKDRERFPMKVTWFGHKQRDSFYNKYQKYNKRFGTVIPNKVSALVYRMKKRRGQVKFLFKTVRYKEWDFACTRTNRIIRITRRGKVEYEENCVPTTFKWKTKKAKPIVVPAHTAKGIRRGRFVVFMTDYSTAKASRAGFPLQVYKTKKKKRLIGIFGIKL